MGWILVYVAVIVINAIRLQPDAFWIGYHRVKFYITLCIGLGATAWFAAGGARDLIRLVRALRALRRDAADDGTAE